jgi:hypothetical protein
MATDREGTTISTSDELLLAGVVESITGNSVVVVLDDGAALRADGSDCLVASSVATQTDLVDYLPLAGGTMTGDLTATGVGIGTAPSGSWDLNVSNGLNLQGGDLRVGSGANIRWGGRQAIIGNTTTNAITIGAGQTSWTDVIFDFGGGEVARFDATGLGIGTSPSHALHVSALSGEAVVAAQELRIERGSASAPSVIFNGTGTPGIAPASFVDVRGAGGAIVFRLDSTNNTASIGNTSPTANEMLYIDAATKGIGGVSVLCDTGAADWFFKGVTANQSFGSGLASLGASGTDVQLIMRSGTTTVHKLVTDGTASYIQGGGLIVGGTSMTSDGLFDVQSTTQASYPFPRMTTTQRDAMAASWGSGEEGAHVYNLTDSKTQKWNGSSWDDLG